jgi:hypothetical protein
MENESSLKVQGEKGKGEKGKGEKVQGEKVQGEKEGKVEREELKVYEILRNCVTCGYELQSEGVHQPLPQVWQGAV